MRVTLVQPCIGRRVGEPYIKTWQMEPLAPAVLAGLTPPGVEIKFYDDRLEPIPYDEPTDLAAITVETYTAKRAYQIASECRRRGVPVVMGGFHATLVPDEVAEYAEAVVVGPAEGIWPRVLEDFRNGRPQRVYRGARPDVRGAMPDRSIYRGKRYLPIRLVETSRGCRFQCEFCAIQTVYARKHVRRSAEEIVEEIRPFKDQVIFFVDDNIAGDLREAKEFFRALIPHKIRWVSQATITVAHDEECLRLMKESGCMGLLIGFESLDEENLKRMNKGFNAMRGGYEAALANLKRFGFWIYATFIFGYDGDRGDTHGDVLRFALKHKFFTAAFNHLVPWPGTPLYRRLEREGRLKHDAWWLHPDFRFGMLPFDPVGLTAEEVRGRCLDARKAFFRYPSILRRTFEFKANSNTFSKFLNTFLINLTMRKEVTQRDGYPLGDEAYAGSLIKVEAPELEEAACGSS